MERVARGGAPEPGNQPRTTLFPLFPLLVYPDDDRSASTRRIFLIDRYLSMKRKSDGVLNGQRKKRSQLQLLDLPMDVVCSIISLLPIRDAVRTSILSRQWKYIWCDHANLTFDCWTLKRGCKNASPFDCRVGEHEFIAMVDGVLEQHSGTGADLLEIRCDLHNEHADHVDRWIKFAVLSKAKELILDLCNTTESMLSADMPYELPANKPQPYNFPCHLFGTSEGSYLQCLQLASVSLQLPADFNGFLNLKRLSMLDVNITNEHVESLLSKCNLLEFLEIACCRMLTTLRPLCPLYRLKHLKVRDCIFVPQIEMNCGLTTLEYSGPMVPLHFATTTSLTNVCINLSCGTSPLDYMTTGFPSTLHHLETLDLRCGKHERAISPVKPHNFIYLRHLRLELNISEHGEVRKTDVLDYAYLLDCAPSLEKLELHMWMRCHHQPYHKEHGELRSLLPQRQHTHLESVHITGFFGHKDQVELALHILSCSPMLKAMKIDSRVKIMPGGRLYWSHPDYRRHPDYRTVQYVDGYVAATEFVRGADCNNIVEVAGAQLMGRSLDGKCFYVWEPGT